MKCNVGKTDRILRAILGLAILGWGYSVGSLWGLIGLVPLIVAAVGICPGYMLFNFSTCKPNDTQQPK